MISRATRAQSFLISFMASMRIIYNEKTYTIEKVTYKKMTYLSISIGSSPTVGSSKISTFGL